MHIIRAFFWRGARLIAAGVFLGLAVVVHLQQQHYAAYLPANTQIGPIMLGGEVRRVEVAAILATNTAKLRLRLNLSGKPLEYPLATTGIGYDIPAVTSQVNTQSKQLFISSILHKPAPLHLPVVIDEAKLAAFTQVIAKEQSSELVRARISLSDAVVQVHAGKSASRYDAQQLAAAIKTKALSGVLMVEASPVVAAPPNTPVQLVQAQANLQKMINIPATIMIGARSFTTAPADRFSWITIEELPAGDFKFTVDPGKVTNYVKTVASTVYQAPSTTTITLLDNAEIARQNGTPGALLAVGAVADQISARLMSGNRESIPVTLATIASPVRYVRTYSRSPTGLNLLIRDFAAERRATFGVVMDDLGGPLDASYNAGTTFVTASIFKTFLAYAVLNKVDTGEYSMSTLTPGGNTVQAAIDKMIHVSDNQTAYELHQLYGFTNIDPFLHAQGFNSTVLNNYNTSGQVISSKITIASDTASLLTRLQAGTLLSSGSSGYLLNLLKNQVYRQGIPAGSVPSPVANKVGFLGSYIHDAGIVYSPSGTYVLVVLTNGGTWADIAELSRRIYGLYNR